MQKNHQDSKNSRFLWLGGIALAAVSAAAAISLCSMRVDIRKQEVLESYGSSVSAWLEGTASSVALWEDEQRALRLRISDSETYRLFAGDLYGLDAPSAEKAPFLADDVPAIRRLLKEYMDFSGLNDARIIGSSGSTLLSSQSTPAPLSALQQKAARLVMASGKSMRLPVRGSTSGLMLDVFEPVRALEGGEPVAAAFMSSHPVLPSLAQFSARPKPEELSESFFLQRNAFASGEPGASWELLMAPKPRTLDSGIAHELEKSGGELALALRPSVSTLGSVYSAARAVPGSGWSVILETPAAVLEERMFRAALPGGLTDLFVVLGVEIFFLTFGFTEAELSTMSAILLIVIGIMVLYEVCKPFDWKRRVLWGAMAGSSAVTILGFGGSFGLSPLGTQAFLVLLVFLGLAYSIMRFMLGLFDQGERLLNRGRHLRKRR